MRDFGSSQCGDCINCFEERGHSHITVDVLNEQIDVYRGNVNVGGRHLCEIVDRIECFGYLTEGLWRAVITGCFNFYSI